MANQNQRGSILLACVAMLMGFLSLWACWVISGASFVSVASKMGSTQTAVHIGNGYQERMSLRDHDKTFSVSDAAGATVEVANKKRPFGILRYSPGKDNIGSMVMEIIPPKSHYPGDPQGQAFAAGVQSGRFLKSIFCSNYIFSGKHMFLLAVVLFFICVFLPE
ncbi:unnamed protein product [Polarella glacialis]|uniref:Uncharacterized protein n=1 Tax=Polarella glacialis TaxID=89957 RepID=A0A813HY58_POLGL|nr:unnamed protein product [Polarella glacialis]CAE8706557.1 unnamed protein product [Polarella glacialis]